MSAVEQLRRVLALIPALADDRDHSLAEITAQLGVDVDTLRRDLRSLADRFDDPGGFVEGVQIYLERETVSIRSDHFLRPMRLTVAELGALELGLALLRSERPPEEQAPLERARKRLRAAMARMPDDPEPMDPRTAAVTATPEERAALALLRRAMRERRVVALAYRGSADQAATERVVRPYAAAYATGAWYLVAHCERSGGLRVFRLDRMERYALGDAGFEMPADVSLDEVVKDGRVFVGAPARTARIRYGPAVARWVAERERRPLADDGSLTLEHPLADLRWLVRHVLQYGADAEVLEPPEARAAVRAALEALE